MHVPRVRDAREHLLHPGGHSPAGAPHRQNMTASIAEQDIRDKATLRHKAQRTTNTMTHSTRAEPSPASLQTHTRLIAERTLQQLTQRSTPKSADHQSPSPALHCCPNRPILSRTPLPDTRLVTPAPHKHRRPFIYTLSSDSEHTTAAPTHTPQRTSRTDTRRSATLP